MITIVGGGPVGALLAIALSKRGLKVHVIERRGDLRSKQVEEGKSINLAVSTRGLFALGEIGLKEKILEHAIAMPGRMVHAVDEALNFQPYGKTLADSIYSFSRSELNRILLEEGGKSPLVSFDFHSRVVDYSPEKNILSVRNERNQSHREHKVDVVIGADGSASAIRQALLRLQGASCSETPLDYGYKELELPSGAGGKFQIEKNALHIWPRGNFMLIALPNANGSFTCTLFLPFKGDISFDALKNPEEVGAFFQKYFKLPHEKIPDLTRQFFEHPTGTMTTVKMTPWNLGGKALLIGDAAHAIVPFFGQGMNCGFEDVTYLCEKWLPKTPLDKVFEEFSMQRKPNADAIADMAVENFVEMRDKVAQPRFLLEKQIERVLQARFPDYVSRYSFVTFSRVPYRFALEIGRIENQILEKLSRGIKTVEDLDLNLAEELVNRDLLPKLKS